MQLVSKHCSVSVRSTRASKTGASKKKLTQTTRAQARLHARLHAFPHTSPYTGPSDSCSLGSAHPQSYCPADAPAVGSADRDADHCAIVDTHGDADNITDDLADVHTDGEADRLADGDANGAANRAPHGTRARAWVHGWARVNW